MKLIYSKLRMDVTRSLTTETQRGHREYSLHPIAICYIVVRCGALWTREAFPLPLLVKALGQGDLFTQRLGGRHQARFGIQAEEVPRLIIEPLLPYVPAVMLISINGKEGAGRRFVPKLIPFRRAGAVQHASLIEEDAPALRNTHDELVNLSAPAEITLPEHERAGGGGAAWAGTCVNCL